MGYGGGIVAILNRAVIASERRQTGLRLEQPEANERELAGSAWILLILQAMNQQGLVLTNENNLMKSIGLLAWVLVFVSPSATRAVAGPGGGQPLELNIQMVPGIWIAGANGSVNIEYTTNLDQAGGWALLATVQATNSPYFFADATATNAPKRFYRAGNLKIPAVNPDPTHLVWINAGTFTMGSPGSEADRDSREDSQTQVTISQGFWMSKHETTQEEYLAVIGNNPSAFTGDLKRPVEQVSWNDATNYCVKLTVRERAAGRLPVGYAYRLPTEAEWEYCCRAGTTTRFSYGDDADYTQLGNYAWYSDNSNRQSHGVGQKRPNAWGLYDMHGNVYEWCLDWYDPYHGGIVTDPRGKNTGTIRVLRGGGWNSLGWSCRAAFRYGDSPAYQSYILGFRSVLAPDQ